VPAGICAARTVHVEGESPFAYLAETYPTYEPDENDSDAA